MAYRTAVAICAPEQRMLNGLQFAQDACEKDWTVFLLVDEKLSRAMDSGRLADELWLADRRAARGQLNAVANPAITKGQYEGVQRTLTGDDAGGHVILLLSLENGGFQVSLNAINRGKLVTVELLPTAAFMGAIRGVIAASDSA
jgi:hypothetical protein